jgi:hypothetical protein
MPLIFLRADAAMPRAGFMLFVGPKLAKLSSPQAVALLRSLVMYLQYLSLSLDIRLRWPPELLAAFGWLKARQAMGETRLSWREEQHATAGAHSRALTPLRPLVPQALTNGIDLAAPECVSNTWSCACARGPCVRALMRALSGSLVADVHARCAVHLCRRAVCEAAAGRPGVLVRRRVPVA